MKARSLTPSRFGRDIYVDEQVVLANPAEDAAGKSIIPFILAALATFFIFKRK